MIVGWYLPYPDANGNETVAAHAIRKRSIPPREVGGMLGCSAAPHGEDILRR